MGMNHLIGGEPDKAIEPLQEALRLDPLETRMPCMNLLGIAYYAAGEYGKAIDTIDYDVNRGGLRGPHMTSFIAAAQARRGQPTEARRLVENLLNDYPDFPYRGWISIWVKDPAQLRQTMEALSAAGLRAALEAEILEAL